MLSISLALVIGILSVIAFYSQIFGLHKTDIHDHLLAVQEMSHRWQWNLYSLFYLLTYLLSFGMGNFSVISCAAMALLTLSVIAKGILSYLVLKNASGRKLIAAFATIALVLIMPLPNWWKPEQIYLDKIAPNLWFNSTFILTMPFAVLLFFSAISWLRTLSLRSWLWVLISCLMSVLTKPNYALAFIPALGVAVLIRITIFQNREFARALWCFAGLTLVAIFILGLQYADSYLSSGVTPSASATSSPFIIAPFAVWTLYSPNIPASLLLSIAFPLSVAILYFDKIKANLPTLLAWGVWLVALLQYILLAETGEYFRDGNWGWGSNIAMYIVFLTSMMVVLSEPISRRFYLVTVVWTLHLATGIYYFVNISRGIGDL
jgi:hypothetical protein